MEPDARKDLKQASNFAIVCSYLEKFGVDLGVQLTFPQLINFLVNFQEACKSWRALHERLLSRVKYRTHNGWEKALVRFCSKHNQEDEGVLVEVGYLGLSWPSRLRILLRLLECQFDLNAKFKTKINQIDSKTLHSTALGTDRFGRVYWLFIDKDYNFLLYRENMEEDNMKMLCDSMEELESLLEKLRDPEKCDEDSEGGKKSGTPSDSDLDEKCDVITLIAKTKINGHKSEREEAEREVKLEIKNEPGSTADNEEDVHKNSEKACEPSAIMTASEIKKEVIGEESSAVPMEVDAPGNGMEVEKSSKSGEIEKEESQEKGNEKSEHAKGGLSEKDKEVSVDEADSNSKKGAVVEGKESVSNGDEDTTHEDGNVRTENDDKSKNRSEEKVDEPKEVSEKKKKKKGEVKEKEKEESEEENMKAENAPSQDKMNKKVEKANQRGRKGAGNTSEKKTNGKVKSSEPAVDPSNLRRSSRQRKPVNLFTIDSSPSKRSRKSKGGPAKEEEEVEDEEEEEEVTPDKKKKKRGRKRGEKKASKDKTKSKDKLKKETKALKKAEREKRKKEKELQKELKEKEKLLKKKKKRKKGMNPWEKDSSSDEQDQDYDEQFFLEYLEEEEEDDVSSLKSSSHVWTDAPESDFDHNMVDSSDDEEALKKRGRNFALSRRRSKATVESHVKDAECKVCTSGKNPQWILLCDKCDAEYHAMCLRPPLMLIPEGDWFCPICQHKSLVERLEEKAKELASNVKKVDAKLRMKERLDFVSISLSNIITCDSRRGRSQDAADGKYDDEYDSDSLDEDNNREYDSSSRSQSSSGSESQSETESSSSEEEMQQRVTRTRRTVKYTFDEFDERIDEAIGNDDKYRAMKEEVYYDENQEKEAETVVDAEEKGVEKEGEEEEGKKDEGEGVVVGEGEGEGEAEDGTKGGEGEKGEEEGEEEEDEEEAPMSPATRDANPTRNRDRDGPGGKDMSSILGPNWREKDYGRPEPVSGRSRRQKKKANQLSDVESEDDASDEDYKVDEDEDDSSDANWKEEEESEVSSDESWLASTRRRSSRIRSSQSTRSSRHGHRSSSRKKKKKKKHSRSKSSRSRGGSRRRGRGDDDSDEDWQPSRPRRAASRAIRYNFSSSAESANEEDVGESEEEDGRPKLHRSKKTSKPKKKQESSEEEYKVDDDEEEEEPEDEDAEEEEEEEDEDDREIIKKAKKRLISSDEEEEITKGNRQGHESKPDAKRKRIVESDEEVDEEEVVTEQKKEDEDKDDKLPSPKPVNVTKEEKDIEDDVEEDDEDVEDQVEMDYEEDQGEDDDEEEDSDERKIQEAIAKELGEGENSQEKTNFSPEPDQDSESQLQPGMLSLLSDPPRPPLYVPGIPAQPSASAPAPFYDPPAPSGAFSMTSLLAQDSPTDYYSPPVSSFVQPQYLQPDEISYPPSSSTLPPQPPQS